MYNTLFFILFSPLCFVLCRLAVLGIPFVQGLIYSAHFSFGERAKYSLKYNLLLYASYLVLGIPCLVYIIKQLHIAHVFSREGYYVVKGFAQAANNCVGLVLARHTHANPTKPSNKQGPAASRYSRPGGHRH